MLIGVVVAGIAMGSICPVFAAEKMPHEIQCRLSGIISSVCYIRGWAGKPESYIDEFINGSMVSVRNQDFLVTDENQKLYRDMCVTFFNEGRNDALKDLSFRQAKANESIIEQQIPVMCMKAN